ncbi:hypothetical protein PIB30_094222 [Stylosanthes scabra]|uniref:Uncharacterized protein n=1 Tax=Stylosanthes scabra TaxID=79078 RepID=A0ABU6VVC6_9FABA|nr:hypothetical protein [Stylosanthes scabra]
MCRPSAERTDAAGSDHAHDTRMCPLGAERDSDGGTKISSWMGKSSGRVRRSQAAHVPDHPARPRHRHPRQAHPACHTPAAPQPYPHHQPPPSSPSGADLVCSTCP